MPQYKLHAKNFAITYSQCPLTKQIAFDFFIKKFEQKIQYLQVSQEDHKDGNKHLHIALFLTSRIHLTDARTFDLGNDQSELLSGRLGRVSELYAYHPNIQACRNPRDWHAYISKHDDNPLIHGEFIRGRNKQADWNTATTCATATDFMEYVKSNFARDYVLAHERIEYFVNKNYRKTVDQYIPIYPRESYHETDAMRNWINQLTEIR